MSSPESGTEDRRRGLEPDRGVAARIAELVSAGSIELAPRDREQVAEAAALLPASTRVYVTALPKHSITATLEGLRAIRAAGLDPVPHVAARRIGSRAELAGFLRDAVREHGVRRVLLIGGDEPQARGPYPDALTLLRDGPLAEAGVREVGIAGYPEGHPRIPPPVLNAAFSEKLAEIAAQGLGAYVVTQFSLVPARVVEYCAALARTAPTVPVYVGIAGPTDPVALLRYAQRCGVSASLRALRTLGVGVVRIVSHTDPREQLLAVAHYCESHDACNVVGAHFFSFGGFLETARWMNRTIADATTATFAGAQSTE
jgi:methylenetetrahydrofolate reductase (NADPH)